MALQDVKSVRFFLNAENQEVFSIVKNPGEVEAGKAANIVVFGEGIPEHFNGVEKGNSSGTWH